jgi:hypothetical protein
MTDDLVLEQNVFFLHAFADVMDDERCAKQRVLLAHNPNVSHSASKVPRDDVSSPKVFGS